MILLPLLAAAAAATPTASPKPAPCSITWSADDDLRSRVRDAGGFEFEGFDTLCPLLRDRKMGLSVLSSNGVLNGRAYAWVVVGLYDRDTGVDGSEIRSTTTIETRADSVTAKAAELDSLNTAITAIARNPQFYIRSVEQQRERLRAALVK